MRSCTGRPSYLKQGNHIRSRELVGGQSCLVEHDQQDWGEGEGGGKGGAGREERRREAPKMRRLAGDPLY